MKSVFTSKENKPTADDLDNALGQTAALWHDLAAFTIQKFPEAKEEWKFSGEKFGWSFRISDRKRVLLYLLPRDNFFKAAFVFGQKATEQVLAAPVSQEIKNELNKAKVYTEGRGIRLTVYDGTNLPDIRRLIEIKISN